MRKEVLLIIYRNKKVLLGFKHPEKKFGKTWNGWGGGINPGESLEEAIEREISEETQGNIKVKNPRKKGIIHFKFETEEPDHYVHILSSEEYEGELTPTTDFIEYKEFKINQLPDEMMPADKKWIPYLASEKFFKGEILFDKEFKNPQVNIYEVETLD